MVIDAAARSRIDRFLGRVEAHLPDRSEEERDELLRDLESHIHDALAGRESATRDDVEVVIAEMDPPETYGVLRRTPPAPPTSARSTETKIAIWLVIAGVAGLLLVSILYELVRHDDPYRHVPPKMAWFAFWGCQLTAAGFGLFAALRKVSTIPPADRGPAWARLSLALLVGSVLLFTGAGMLIDIPGEDLVPLLVVVGILGVLGACLSGRVAHSAERPTHQGSLQPLGRIGPALVSLTVTFILIAGPLTVLRHMARSNHMFRRDYDLSDAWPEPLLWAGITIGIFAVEAGLLVLIGRITTVGVKGLFWPLLNHVEGNGNRGFAVMAAAFAVLAAGFLAAWFLWP